MTIKSWKYPGGEIGVRVEETLPNIPTFRIQSSDDLITMIMALNCAKHRHETVNEICIPYLPYARQDRVATIGDPNAIEVLASLIATTGVNKVHSYDVHSEKSVTAFSCAGITLISESPVPYILKFLYDIREPTVYFIAPDKGAAEKTIGYSAALKEVNKGVIQCLKVRDPVSGKLTGFAVSKNDLVIEPDAAFVITDDIVDGGRTFLGVYDALNAEYGDHPTYLFTTHGIYSQGVDILLTKLKQVASTDSFTPMPSNVISTKHNIYPIKGI